MPRDTVAPTVDTGGSAEFACEVEGCGVTKGTRAALGVHRWNAHRLRGAGKHAKAKSTKSPTGAPTGASPSPGTQDKPKSSPGGVGGGNRPTGRRKDGTKVCGGAWKLAAKYLVPRVSQPAGKVMEWQSSYAGSVLDAAVAHSRLDRMIVQRAAGKGADMQALGSLLGLPAIIIAVGANPSLAYESTVQEMLRGIVQANFKHLLAGRLKEQKEEAELEAMAAEAGESYWAIDADGRILLDEKGRKISMVDGLVAEILGMVAQPAQAVAV